MKDILQQIQNLKEDFSSILEDAVRKAERRNLDKTIKADHKEVKDLKKNIKDCWRRHSHYSFPSQDSEKINNERIGYVKKLKDIITKGNEKLLKRDELNKREAKEAGKEQLAIDKAQSNKFSLTSESLDILQQIQNLKEDFMNLIEVEGLGQPASDVPPSTNKIKKDKKTKNGKVELVSVEDELFPYDGNKREQYRQKIIDTINGMIQGTATLEDLLQIVRQKKMPVKENLENQVEKKFKKGDINLDKAFDLIKKIESKMSSEKNNQERNDKIEKDAMKMSPSMERASYLRQVGKAIRRNQRKNALTFEALEEIINELNTSTVKDALNKRIDKSIEADDKEREEFNDILKMKNRDERAKAYKKFEDKSLARFDKENKKYDLYANYAKKHPELLEALELLEKLTEKDRQEAAKKVLPQRKREYLSKYGDVLDAADMYGSEEVPDGNMKDLERAEKRYKDAEKKAEVAPKCAGRKYNTKENFDKTEEKEYNKCKALTLWEQVINEIEDGAINRAVDSARGIIAFTRKIQGMSGSKEFKDKIEDAIAKKNHQIEVVNNKKEDKVIDRTKEDEAKKKKRK